jgi:hypothetical protein
MTDGPGSSEGQAPAAAPPATGDRRMTALRWSALLTLAGLGFMAWSMLAPTPLPVMLAMSVGQALGCAAFAIYLFIVVRDVRRERRRDRP